MERAVTFSIVETNFGSPSNNGLLLFTAESLAIRSYKDLGRAVRERR